MTPEQEKTVKKQEELGWILVTGSDNNVFNGAVIMEGDQGISWFVTKEGKITKTIK